MAQFKEYSALVLLFFTWILNPVVAHDFDEEKNGGEFRVELHNAFPGVELDIVLIFDAAKEEEEWIRVFDKMMPCERIYHAYEGDLLRASIAGTNKVVSDTEVNSDWTQCTIYKIGSASAELFQAPRTLT